MHGVQMSYGLSVSLFTVALFLGMLFFLELGRRIGARRMRRDPEGARAGAGVVDGAVFALLGLLIAFTFSGAGARFDKRRELVVEETNAIGTAYLRIDLLGPNTQAGLREKFRRYVDSRLEVYRKLPNIAEARAELQGSAKLQREIWDDAVAACRAEGSQPAATMLLLPALNAMIDITTTRTMATQMHPPQIIFIMLFGLALASSLLAGHGMAAGRSRSWIHLTGFALVMALAVYVVLDIEFPRLGFIRIDPIDQELVELRGTMQ
jgi:hypothetical protein